MLRKALATLPVLLVAATFAQAQIQGSFSIRGQILAPSAGAADRVEVILERAEGQVVARTFSDNLGNYEFRNLTPGTYEVVVRLEGYEEARHRVEGGSGLFAGTPVDADEEQRQRAELGTPFGGPAVVNIVLTKERDGAPASGADDPNFAGDAELSRKYPKKVVQEYERALEDNRKGNTAKATERLQAVLKLAPDFYYAHNSLGALYQKTERYRDAEKEYNLARERNPRWAQPLVNLGSLYIEEADARADEEASVVGIILDQALDALEEAIKLEPRAAFAHYLLGTAYYKSEFYEEAEANLQRALQIEFGMAPARLMLVNVYIRQEKWQNALEHLDAYLEENPKAAGRAQIQEIRSKVFEAAAK